MSSGTPPSAGATAPRASPLFLRDEELDRALEMLLSAARQLTARDGGAAPGRGLSAAELDLLWLIHRRPGASAAELGRLLGSSKQSTSRHLAALEAAGLVRREPHGADRRRRALRPTEAGAALAAALAETRRQALRRAFRAAGPEAVAGFQRVLGALVEAGRRRPSAPGRS